MGDFNIVIHLVCFVHAVLCKQIFANTRPPVPSPPVIDSSRFLRNVLRVPVVRRWVVIYPHHIYRLKFLRRPLAARNPPSPLLRHHTHPAGFVHLVHAVIVLSVFRVQNFNCSFNFHRYPPNTFLRRNGNTDTSGKPPRILRLPTGGAGRCRPLCAHTPSIPSTK